MYTPKPVFPRDNGNVIILGAGASYGSSLKCKPPIIKDFVRKSKEFGIFNKYLLLWEFLDSIGYNIEEIIKGNPDIEKIFSILDILSTGLWFKNESDYYHEIGRYLKILPNDLLRSFIIEMICRPSIEALNNPCVYHNRIFKELKSGDIVISFNYDLIAESSLYKMEKWSEFNGYGFYCLETLFKGKKAYNSFCNPEKYWLALKDSEVKDHLSKIFLLKPHGSINWFLSSRSSYEKALFNSSIFHNRLFDIEKTKSSKKIHALSLKKILKNKGKEIMHLPINAFEEIKYLSKALMANPENYTLFPRIKEFSYTRLNYGSFIIPPSIYKFTSPQPYEMIEIWTIIKNSLPKAKRILVVGFSFGEADLQFNTIFRLAIRNNENSDFKIGIIDPRKDDIKRKLEGFSDKKLKIEKLGEKLSEVSNINLKSFFSE